MADTYDQIIIQKILGNDVLKQAVLDLKDQGVLNLVDENWEDILKNSVVYQKHLNKEVKFTTPQNFLNTTPKHYCKHYIVSRENYFEVLVAGYFKVYEKSIIVSYCKPIVEIGGVMCTKELIQNCKFFLNSCFANCSHCSSISTPDNEWCLKSSKVLTTNGIEYAERNYMEKMFRQATLAVARIEISMKYYFANLSKVGGNIKSIIFVPENLLGPKEKIHSVLSCNMSVIPKEIKIKEDVKNSILCLPKGFKDAESEETFDVSTTKI